MLPKKLRLRDKKDFARVYQQGRSSLSKFFLMKSKANNLGHNRFGIVVSKKVALKIVQRNRLKRRIREALKKMIKERKLKDGYDIVVVARAGSLDLSFLKIREELKKLFQRQNLWYEKGCFEND